MKRFDLRHLKNDFGGRLEEILQTQLQQGDVGIFLFALIDFEKVQKSSAIEGKRGNKVLNSLQFKYVDGTSFVRKVA